MSQSSPECRAEYRQENRELLRQKQREYRRKNLARIKEYRRANAAAIAEYQRAYTAWWRIVNEGKIAASKRADGVKRTVGKGAEELAYARILRCDPCCYCGAPCEAIDHIVPVHAGGPNRWENLTAACKRCNAAKKNKQLLIYMGDRYATAS